MRHRGRSVGLHEERCLARARAAFAEVEPILGRTMEERGVEVAALPTVMWKGRQLRTIRCHADFGKGPHDVNVPESLLWSLLDFCAFRCPYHR